MSISIPAKSSSREPFPFKDDDFLFDGLDRFPQDLILHDRLPDLCRSRCCSRVDGQFRKDWRLTSRVITRHPPQGDVAPISLPLFRRKVSADAGATMMNDMMIHSETCRMRIDLFVRWGPSAQADSSNIAVREPPRFSGRLLQPPG